MLVERKLKNIDPLIMAHRGGCGHGKENTMVAVLASLEYKPDIIEVDVRKSRDGILYCYHGAGMLGLFFVQFFRFLNFSTIVKLALPPKLSEITSLIPASVDFYLDIKQSDIKSAEIKSAIAHCQSKRIWIAPYTLVHLCALRQSLDPAYVYVLNRPYFNIKKTIVNCDGVADVIQLWWWQCREEILEKLKEKKVVWYMSSWFMRKENIIPNAVKAGSAFICVDNLKGVKEKMMSIIS